MRLSRMLIAIIFFMAVAGELLSQESKTTSESVVSSLDKAADPCVDFYQFACGVWIKNNPIPAD